VWGGISSHGSYMEPEVKKKFTSILAQIKAEHANAPTALNTDKNSRILLVDGTNNFIRCWIATPTLNDHGEHVGGISGFLLSIGYAIKLFRPTRVIIVFDGQGGSKRRKDLYPEYKSQRSTPKRINRAYEDMSDPEMEHKAIIEQMSTLIGFLKYLPVSVIAIDYIEADDAIGYISTQMFKESKITIMSGDKDFLQLVNERVSIWSPIKKKAYGISDIISEYGVHPTNFVYYRILEGDKSDNIPGVGGIQLATAKKIFPMLAESTETSVARILELAKDRINERKAFANIVENADIVSRNYMLMQLKDPNFSPSLQLKVETATEMIYPYNKLHFIQKMSSHGMHSTIPNYHAWLQEVFWPLSCFK
jgi:5'-3' exonuclease